MTMRFIKQYKISIESFGSLGLSMFRIAALDHRVSTPQCQGPYFEPVAHNLSFVLRLEPFLRIRWRRDFPCILRRWLRLFCLFYIQPP